ncbi:MAG: ECF transporter S component [Oscillospiraceae bacterium]|nr:ECF transporter S component [Oscillospiraceae bacterium]
MTNTRFSTKKLTLVAMLCALAYAVMAVCRIPLVPAATFLKYDPKDVFIAIGGFLLGPIASLAISVVVSFLEMFTVSESGIIGCAMNIISSVALTVTAALIYKKKRSLAGAAIGLISGVCVCTVVMLLWNYILVPIYTPYISREKVVEMLLPAFLPFNLLKGGLNAAITMLLYKPVRIALDKSRLLPIAAEGSAEKSSAKVNIGAFLISAFIIISCVLIILSMFEII